MRACSVIWPVIFGNRLWFKGVFADVKLIINTIIETQGCAVPVGKPWWFGIIGRRRWRWSWRITNMKMKYLAFIQQIKCACRCIQGKQQGYWFFGPVLLMGQWRVWRTLDKRNWRVLSKDYWGMGLMPEAVSAVIKFALTNWIWMLWQLDIFRKYAVRRVIDG